MIDVGTVQGSKEMAIPVWVGKSTVYVHDNIHKVEDPEFPDSDLYEYHEVQYTKDEYLQMMVEQQAANTADIADNREGIMETFEETESNSTDIADLREAVMELYEMIAE